MAYHTLLDFLTNKNIHTIKSGNSFLFQIFTDCLLSTRHSGHKEMKIQAPTHKEFILVKRETKTIHCPEANVIYNVHQKEKRCREDSMLRGMITL